MTATSCPGVIVARTACARMKFSVSSGNWRPRSQPASVFVASYSPEKRRTRFASSLPAAASSGISSLARGIHDAGEQEDGAIGTLPDDAFQVAASERPSLHGRPHDIAAKGVGVDAVERVGCGGREPRHDEARERIGRGRADGGSALGTGGSGDGEK